VEKQTFVIELKGITPDEANRYAGELREALVEASRDIKAEQKRQDESSQDFGSTVVLILGAPSVIIAARAIRDYLKLRRSVSLDIKTPSGHLVAKNLTSDDATSIVQALQSSK
jgi:hypothetical protein